MAIINPTSIEWMTGFEVASEAGATSLAHILTQNSGGATQPTRSTSSPLTGVASFDYNKAGGTAINNADNMYENVTARTAYSATWHWLPSALPTTNGNGAAIGGFTINYAGWGFYVVSSTPRIAILSATPAVADWYGATDLSSAGAYATEFYVTFTHIILDGSQSLGMVILRDVNGYELERSPWVKMNPSPTLSSLNLVLCGPSTTTSGWTSACAFKFDDVVMAYGGVHAPKWCEISLVRPTADGTITVWRSGLTALAGSTTTSYVVAGNFSADVGHFVRFNGKLRRITAAVFSSPNTTYTIESTAGATPGTFDVVGAGYDTDDDGVLFDEVSGTDDGVTSIYTHCGTHVNKFIGFTHGGCGHGTLATVHPADEALLCNVIARVAWAITVGNVSVAPACWHSSQSNVGTFETISATADDPTTFSWAQGGPPIRALPGVSTVMTTAQVDAFEIGTRRLLTGTGSTNEVDVTYVAMEVAKIKIWDDACQDGFTMAEPSLVHMADITAISSANPAVITTERPHGLSTGDVVTIIQSDSGVSVDGTHTATVTGASTFSVPVNNSGAVGTKGVVIMDHFRITAMSATNPCIVTCSGDLGTSPCEMGTATSGTSTTVLEDSTKSWDTDQWKGGMVMIISATTGLAQKRKIASNNATTLTLDTSWTDPNDGARYVVGFPIQSCNIRGSNSTPRIEGRHFIINQDSGQASAGGATTLDDSGRVWAADQWAGGKVKIISGAGASSTLVTVTTNDADTLTVASWPAGNPDSSSIYRVWTQGNKFVTPINCTGAGTAGKATIRKRKKIHTGVQ